ncbi:hypothetical protein PSDVSF_33920 [Pseudodesulfovibrio sediminis]|uniref:Uncharacterized protein n=1 Tax=Pseudodesulfovibrio sediminis TaxID=2810563 RepID=A0ABM7PAT9_9BACT|nr:hypothetical protein PSDVSF_33920 [Pseudodesulfovibrio sediminis]
MEIQLVNPSEEQADIIDKKSKINTMAHSAMKSSGKRSFAGVSAFFAYSSVSEPYTFLGEIV